MRKLLMLLAFIASTFACNAQDGQLINFGGTRPQDTAYANRSLRVDRVVRIPFYATNDTSKVLGVDSSGRLVLRTKGSATLDTTSLSNRINQKVGYSDTAAMLIGYTRLTKTKSDSATLAGSISGKLSTSDTGGMLTNYARKSQLADTSSSIRSALSGKVSYSDTAAMLSAYLRKSDTATLSSRINSKLNITDTANIRLRPIAGSNITITGTYPNLTFAASGGGGGDTSTPFVPLTFSNPIRTTKDKVSVTATSYTTIYIDSSANGDVGMVDMQNPALNTIRLDGVLKYSMPRSSNDLLTWVNVGGTIKWDVINYAATSGVYQAVAPIGDTLTFAIRGAGFTGYTGNYATTGSSGIATSTEFLSGEGYIQFDVPTTGVFGIGLDSVYNLEAWLTGTTNNYNYSVYFASTNAYSNTLGEDLSVADITAIGAGGIMRFGRNATDQMYLSLSTDGGSSYSVIYTYPGTSTAPMYVKLSGFSGSATITNLRRFF